MSTGRLLLAIDTATRTPVVGLAQPDGQSIVQRRWQSRHRHGERLLPEIDALLEAAATGRAELGAIAVGLGPGSFTGLRIGLATAKVLAHGLRLPLIGLSTTRALALAAGSEGELAVSLPAGVADRYVHRLRVSRDSVEELGPPALVATSEAFTTAVGGARLVAVDIDSDDVRADARTLGLRAVCELAGALSRLASAALAGGRSDDLAALVPAYVALPRGIAQAGEEIRWSPDLR